MRKCKKEILSADVTCSNTTNSFFMKFSLRQRLVVNSLRALWTGLVLWYELGIFYYSVDSCPWPDANLSGAASHVLIVADPQILDHRSYPSRGPYLTYFSRVFTDLNLRKSWSAALRTRPDHVVFLGDMMDGGRSTYSDAE